VHFPESILRPCNFGASQHRFRRYTGRHGLAQNRYRAQLERYAQVLGKLDPCPIRLGLYFPLLGGWREWSGTWELVG
jgi:hypothetical protein